MRRATAIAARMYDMSAEGALGSSFRGVEAVAFAERAQVAAQRPGADALAVGRDGLDEAAALVVAEDAPAMAGDGAGIEEDELASAEGEARGAGLGLAGDDLEREGGDGVRG